MCVCSKRCGVRKPDMADATLFFSVLRKRRSEVFLFILNSLNPAYDKL